MKEANRADFPGYREAEVHRKCTRHYVLLGTGFFLAVIVPLIFGVWTIATGAPIRMLVILMIVMLLVGLVLFGLSRWSPGHCKLCDGPIELFWCIEERAKGRYSGMLAVCHACKAYESHLVSDSD